ncbi:hypothetical protein EYC84_000492 [Monilinia fructicola]|uniref:ABC transporter domain-containing protein n=1 Tax=Monilinia fructicola TaxID=38448 RepID=A0A5M9JR24_MONFR|nr:hypothetical protein EYC84_000492 [Monilinia fructicola]
MSENVLLMPFRQLLSTPKSLPPSNHTSSSSSPPSSPPWVTRLSQSRTPHKPLLWPSLRLSTPTPSRPSSLLSSTPSLPHKNGPKKMTGLDCIEALVESAPTQLALRVPDLIQLFPNRCGIPSQKLRREHTVPWRSVSPSQRTSRRLFTCSVLPLSSLTFTSQTLAIMVPLLDRGLNERETAIKRKSAVIVDNMCKLVEDPNIVAAFLPKLMPGLTKNYDNLADPEAREKTKQGLDTLKRVGAVGADGKIPEPSNAGNVSTVERLSSRISLAPTRTLSSSSQSSHTSPPSLVNSLTRRMPTLTAGPPTLSHSSLPSLARRTLNQLSTTSASVPPQVPKLRMPKKLMMRRVRIFATVPSTWLMVPRFSLTKLTSVSSVVNDMVFAVLTVPESLLSCVLSTTSKLRVSQRRVRSRLCSLSTISIPLTLSKTTIAWTMKKLKEVGVETSQEEVEKQLKEFGFTPEMTNNLITALSGGWKMKLALCRAVFEAPDILLLDEPTNHLDVKNVKWLEEYLQKLPLHIHHRFSRLGFLGQRLPTHHPLREIQAQEIPR